MGWQRFRICPKRTFNFNGLANGQSALIVVAEHIPIGMGTEAQLIVRMHRNDLGGGNLNIRVAPDMYDSGDPGQLFIQTGSTVGGLSAYLDVNTVAGAALVGTAQYFGPGLGALVIEASRSGAGGNVSADISIDVEVKGPFD